MDAVCFRHNRRIILPQEERKQNGSKHVSKKSETKQPFSSIVVSDAYQAHRFDISHVRFPSLGSVAQNVFALSGRIAINLVYRFTSKLDHTHIRF